MRSGAGLHLGSHTRAILFQLAVRRHKNRDVRYAMELITCKDTATRIQTAISELYITEHMIVVNTWYHALVELSTLRTVEWLDIQTNASAAQSLSTSVCQLPLRLLQILLRRFERVMVEKSSYMLTQLGNCRQLLCTVATGSQQLLPCLIPNKFNHTKY